MIKMPKAKLPKPMIPVTKVDVIGTLVMLELGQEEYILFRSVYSPLYILVIHCICVSLYLLINA